MGRIQIRMKIPQVFIPENLETTAKNKPKEQATKRYVLQVYSQQFEECGWVCTPETYYIGVEAENDEEAYRKAAAYHLYYWREFPSFRTEIEDIHGLEHDFCLDKEYEMARSLKQKQNTDLEAIVSKMICLNKKGMYDYIASK